MNTNALRLFLHIMQRGSLVAAATELNMSPSAASRLLTGLERETGLEPTAYCVFSFYPCVN